MDNKWKRVFVVGIVALLILMLLIGLLVGLQSLRKFFSFLLIGLLVIGILFLSGYIFYLIFIKKEFKDIPYTYKKKVLSATKIMRQQMLGNLYLSGDYKHNRIELGKYYYMRIPLPKQVRREKKDADGKPFVNQITKEPEYEEITEPVDVDAFIVSRKGFFNRLFGETTVILTKPSDHDYSAIFNDVTIKGFNLVPLDNQFYTINTRSLDIDISKGVTTMYLREVVHEVMRDLDRMVKQAMSLDSQFQKDKVRSSEFEIPKFAQGLQQGGQNQ